MSDWWKGDWTRFAIAIIATVYFIAYARTASYDHLIDVVNLLVHEAGHIVFMPFGELLYILGGSVFQVLFPLIYVGYFYLRRDLFSASLLLFWVGENVISVSVYAADAIAMQLPLLGGDNLGHDWHNALALLGLLRHTDAIAHAIYLSGVTVIMAACCLAILTSQWSRMRAEA